MGKAPKKGDEDQYGKEEAERRLVAALRGARIAGHKPLKDKPRSKKAKAKKKK